MEENSAMRPGAGAKLENRGRPCQSRAPATRRDVVQLGTAGFKSAGAAARSNGADRWNALAPRKTLLKLALTRNCHMIDGDAKSQSALGFLTVLQNDQQGLVGGYLILNTA